MISGHANVETAVRAVRLGAYDFLEKPLSLERVLLTAQKAIERRDLLAEVASFRGRSEPEASCSASRRRCGSCRRRSRAWRRPTPASSSPARTARARSSSRARSTAARRAPTRRLVEVNCAAIPRSSSSRSSSATCAAPSRAPSEDRRGKFEEADGATLFLDEVGDMSARTQAKVLRALQEGTIHARGRHARPIASDARILSATNKNLAGGDPRAARSARTSTSASPSCRSTSRRCGSAPRTSRCSPALPRAVASQRFGRRPKPLVPRGARRAARPTAGPATSGSSRTSSSVS